MDLFRSDKGMAVTIGSSGGRVVAKKVDVNSYTTIDEVNKRTILEIKVADFLETYQYRYRMRCARVPRGATPSALQALTLPVVM